MNSAAVVLDVLYYSRELKNIHSYIGQYKIPIKKRDSFIEQCIIIGEYLGDRRFEVNVKKIKMNICLFFAFNIPLILLFGGGYLYVKISGNLAGYGDYIFENMFILSSACGCSLIGALFLLYNCFLNRRTYNYLYPELMNKFYQLVPL